MPKMKIEFEGFDEVIKRLKNLEGDLRGTTEKALKETHEFVTQNAEKEIARHRLTGATEASLDRQAKVQWSGEKATVHVGFNIREGGLASIFLMYGTPRVKKDQKLYNAFYGSRTISEIRKIQENVFYDEIRRLGG